MIDSATDVRDQRPPPLRSAVWLTGYGSLNPHNLAGEIRTKPNFVGTLSPAELTYRDFERQDDLENIYIPNRPDRRAMGKQFASGACAAGIALSTAGLTGREQRKDVAMYVATRVAERDENLDAKLLLDGYPGPATNRSIMLGLRPTMFLAQLPNLLAGNLAIVAGVRGVSRTFVGEEIAGVNAIFTASRDITAGRIDVALVGGALNAGREALLRWIGAADLAARPGAGQLNDDPDRGVILGSVAAFAVLEDPEHASVRGAKPIVSVRPLLRRHVMLSDNDLLIAVLEDVRRAAFAIPLLGQTWVITNACGTASTQTQLNFWKQRLDERTAILVSADLYGSALEADAPGALCLATALLSDPDLASRLPSRVFARPGEGPPDNVLIVTCGLEFGVGAVLVQRAS